MIKCQIISTQSNHPNSKLTFFKEDNHDKDIEDDIDDDDVENDNCKCRACPYPCPHLHIKALTRPGAAAIAPGICLLGHILHGRGGHISHSVHMHISQCRRIRAS